MKTIKFLFFAAIFAIHACTGITGDVHLFREGKSDYEIIISKDASEAEKTAASELQKYLQAMTGFQLPVMTDDERKAGKTEILIGRTNRENGAYTVDREELGPEGFHIFWSGKRLVIAGGAERGTIYGVYGFLESLGCRYFAVDVETVPKKETITLSLKDAMKEKPVFEYRDIVWATMDDPYMCAKLRSNGMITTPGVEGGIMRNKPKELGGGLRWAKPDHVHTFQYLVPNDEYAITHPEYFSEMEGKRVTKFWHTQLCLTNPDVLRLSIEKVKSWLRDDPEGKIVSVSQDDSWVFQSNCRCKECAAIDEEEGSPSGSLLRFVNAIADAIKEEFPDVIVETLAYMYSVVPPKITKPRDNVMIRLCAAGYCTAHPYEQCSHNTEFKNSITGWSKICDRLFIWDYTTNFSYFLAPFPNLNTLQPNARFYAENNVKGVYAQGNRYPAKSGEFGELRAYMLAKLLWNPYTDIEKHQQEFLEAFYGSASPYVKEYLDMIHEIAAPDSNFFHLSWDMAEFFKELITDDLMAHFDSIWEQAKHAADNEEIADRVKRAELQHRYYKLLKAGGEVYDANDPAKVQFFQDCLDLGVTRYNEGSDIQSIIDHYK